MHTQTIVAQVMQCCLPLMHAARWRALHDVVVSAVNGHALSLVALAVGTLRTTNVRHRVKCVDRLLGNSPLKAHRFDLYAALARQWLTGLPQLLIVVDWSSLTADINGIGYAPPWCVRVAQSPCTKRFTPARSWAVLQCIHASSSNWHNSFPRARILPSSWPMPGFAIHGFD